MGCTIIRMKKIPLLTLALQEDHEDDGKGGQQHRMMVGMCENMRITKFEKKKKNTKPLT